MLLVSIWMYCCSDACGRPGAGRWPWCLEHLQQRLLDAFARHVAGDGDVLASLADLVDLVDVEHAALGGFDVEVGGVQELQQQVLDVFAHVARLGQRGSVANGKGDIENAGQSLGPTTSCPSPSTDQQDIRLVDLDVGADGPVHQPLVVAVDRDGQDFLGVLLADDVLVELGDDLPGREDLAEQRLAGPTPAAFLFEDRLTEIDALAADVHVAGPFDQRADRRDSSCDRRSKKRFSWWDRFPGVHR